MYSRFLQQKAREKCMSIYNSRNFRAYPLDAYTHYI